MVISRARSAVLGSFVADAATVGLHWIYDQQKVGELVAQAVKSGKSAAFVDPPQGPFYKVTSGDQSPWGHELIPMLETAAKGKPFDGAIYSKACHQYHIDNKGTIPYVNGAIKKTNAALEDGKSWQEAATDDTQAHGMGKAPIIVALYAGKPELISKIEEACKVHQHDQLAIDFAVASAKFLERIVNGATIADTVDWAAKPGNIPQVATDAVKKALLKTSEEFSPACKELGLSCSYPGVFSGAVLELARGKNYKSAIEENALAGGDNCSRAIFIGACLAAEQGEAAIPDEWKTLTQFYAKAEHLLDQM